MSEGASPQPPHLPDQSPVGSASAPSVPVGRIPIPWSVRWRRFCQRFLPALVFANGLLLAGWLWRDQAHAVQIVGEVEATRHVVSSATNGRLIEIAPGHRWTLYEEVAAGELIARLDDRSLLLQIETLRADLARLQAEGAAEEAKLAFQQTDLAQEHEREVTRLLWQHQRRKLLVLDRKVALEFDRVAEQRLQAIAERVEKLLPGRNTSQLEVIIAQKDREQITERIAANRAALVEEERQVADAWQRLNENPALKLPSVELLLAPHQAALRVQEACIAELQAGITQLELRAPYAGTIVSITAEPGQAIRAGDPVVTIAANKGRYVVAFVRPHERLHPQVRDLVELRPQGLTASRWNSEVEDVGPQIEPIPAHLLRDPRVVEWGLPIRIAMRDQISARPGELLNVSLKRSSQR